jgi:hypothetical protein
MIFITTEKKPAEQAICWSLQLTQEVSAEVPLLGIKRIKYEDIKLAHCLKPQLKRDLRYHLI